MADPCSRIGLMKTEVADHLTRNHCKSIMTLLNWPPGVQDDIRNATDLLNEMEGREIIKKNDFSQLVRILETLKLMAAANVVKRHMNAAREVHAVQEQGNCKFTFQLEDDLLHLIEVIIGYKATIFIAAACLSNFILDEGQPIVAMQYAFFAKDIFGDITQGGG